MIEARLKDPGEGLFTPSGNATGNSIRPGVLSAVFRDLAALRAATMPFIQGGGLFVPSTRAGSLGEDVFMLVTLPDDASRHTVSGRIVWVTPAGSTGRQQGLGIQFNPSETSELLRRRIEELTAGTPVAGTPTHTL